MERKDLTKGFLPKQILLFSLPLVVSNLLQVLFNMADIAVVGRFAGELALGAVGSTTTLIALYTGFAIGMGAGVNALTAIVLGEKNKQGIFETVHTSFIVCLLFGLLLMGVSISINGFILTLLKTKSELIDLAKTYLNIYCLAMPAIALYNFGNSTYSAYGNTKKPLMFLALSGIVNVVLNVIFVVGFNFGVKGVGLASIISQYLSATLVIIALSRENNEVHLQLNKVKFYKGRSARIIQFGLIAGFQNAIFFIANLFIQSAVNSFDTITVEGVAAACNADNLVWDVMAAFYIAASSFIGQNYGAKNKKRIMQSYLISLTYSCLIAIVFGGLLVVFSDNFLSFFTTNEFVIAAGKPRLIIMALSYWVSGFMDCTVAASRGLGKTTYPTICVILGSCVFRIIWIVTIFAHFKTIESLYLLYIFSWSLTSILEIPYFLSTYKWLTSRFE